MYALVDGNNFYVSCERVFRPSLIGRPVIVLSNNDGCAIARSNEAKAIGVKMGAPWFQIRELVQSHGLVALSANFALYGDLSDRMMAIAANFAPRQEVYSIDESFLLFEGMPGADLVKMGRLLREQVLGWVGIPTCVGFAATKTLAKLANHVAKTAERKPGSYPDAYAQVLNLSALSAPELNAVLAATPVGEVWGVGRRISAKLIEHGIHTALDLAQADAKVLRREFSVVLEKTSLELQGVSCATLEDGPADKKQIACTRSFGQPVLEHAPLAEAISTFASRAAEKLRRQHSVAGALVVFIRTSPFRTDDPQYSRSVAVPLCHPTSDTHVLVSAALAGLRQIYRSGFKFAKAGVMLLDLMPDTFQQGQLDLLRPADGLEQPAEKRALMKTVDALNHRYGRGSVSVASAGARATAGAATGGWTMRQERRTPAYTTCWEDIATVRA